MSHDDSYTHEDPWRFLGDAGSLQQKLIDAHRVLQARFDFVARIALALYDPDTSVLRTYLHSSGDDAPLDHYEARITDAPSLQELLARGHPRVINRMLTFERGEALHHQRLGRQGYAASYTMPIFDQGLFVGFLFFNAYDEDVFTEAVLPEIDLFGHMLALMVINELASVRTLQAAVRTTGHLTHHRDPETGSHLDRMSRYARLIAQGLATSHDLSDDFIEHVFMFAPLHDIGKIAIPDRILMKPARLDDEEMTVMRTHATLGGTMVEELVENFGLAGVGHVEIMRNIALYHHEAVNGTGYPEGRRKEEIPLEARIVAVADIFDALTSKRVYKEAWSNDDAFAALTEMADAQLDPACVDALLAEQAAIEAIQARFREDEIGT